MGKIGSIDCFAHRRSGLTQLLKGRWQRFEVALTPAPRFAGLIRHDDWMLRRAEVIGCMLVLRAITAADMATAHTQAQMDPAVPQFEALHAAVATRRHDIDLIKMPATSHRHPPSV